MGREATRIVLELPPLQLAELLLLAIALILARAVWLLAEVASILRKASADEPKEGKVGRMLRGTSDKMKESAPRATDRVLRASTQLFEQAMIGETDVDVGKFMDACRFYGDKVLTRMGTFTMITVREIHANMDKIKHTYQLHPEQHRSMIALLEAECSSDMHQPGGILADPSAAMGLVWARRGLLFWIRLFRQHMVDGDEEIPTTPTITSHSSVIHAYEEVLAPFNGWVTRNTFMLATRAFPEWQEIEATWASKREDAMADMTAWVQVLEPLLDRMDVIIRKLDLNDMRKSI